MKKNAWPMKRQALPTKCLLLCPLILTACASEPPVAVTVKGDSYCEIARKVKWSKQDTKGTIRQVHRENQKIDRVCGAA